MTVKSPKKTVTYSAANIAKSKQTFAIKASAKTKLSYSVSKVPLKGAEKYIKVTKKGKVTLKKNAPGGVYKIKIKAAKTSAYKSATATVKIKVKGAKG